MDLEKDVLKWFCFESRIYCSIFHIASHRCYNFSYLIILSKGNFGLHYYIYELISIFLQWKCVVVYVFTFKCLVSLSYIGFDQCQVLAGKWRLALTTWSWLVCCYWLLRKCREIGDSLNCKKKLNKVFVVLQVSISYLWFL